MRFMKSYKNAFERIDVTMRKLTALLMMIVLVFSLAACSNTSSDKENSTHGSVQQGAPQDPKTMHPNCPIPPHRQKQTMEKRWWFTIQHPETQSVLRKILLKSPVQICLKLSL